MGWEQGGTTWAVACLGLSTLYSTDPDAFPLAMLLSFLLPLLPGAGLAWCYYQLPTLCQQPGRCCRRDALCNR